MVDVVKHKKVKFTTPFFGPFYEKNWNINKIITENYHPKMNCLQMGGGGYMVLTATFNNISVISWLSVLLVAETKVPRENH